MSIAEGLDGVMRRRSVHGRCAPTKTAVLPFGIDGRPRTSSYSLTGRTGLMDFTSYKLLYVPRRQVDIDRTAATLPQRDDGLVG